MKTVTFKIGRHIGSRSCWVGLGLWLLVGGQMHLPAQWTSQSFFLHPGWNAIYLEVQPEPRRADIVFTNRPVESVWRWSRSFSSVQYLQDPEALLPGDPDWMAWFPPATPERAAMNMHTMEAGRAYLIKVPETASPFVWVVQGRPVLPPSEWVTDSFNLVGAAANPFNPPTFGGYFGESPAHVGQPIYRLDASGLWQLVVNPATTQILSGEAFWIRSEGHSEFAGTMAVETVQADGLHYGRTLTEQTLRIRNESAQAKAITIRQIPSALPPIGQLPMYAGEVPLSYYEVNLALGQNGWRPLQSFLQRPVLGPGEEWRLRLSVRRKDMNPFTPPAGVTDVLYQSMLEITDNAGTRVMVAVTSEGLQSYAPVASGGSGGAVLPHRRTGLWVGDAVIGKVNQPAHPSQPDLPVATATDFQIRLLVHVDASGQPRLLQKVLQMWKEGTTKPDPDNPELQVVDEPGRYVLLTDETLIGDYAGATLRDGDAVGRRISSAAFSFEEPVAMAGAGEFGANTVQCQVVLDYRDPMNPFVHRYHPDHNNLDERFEQPLPEGDESFSVIRNLELQFQSNDPEGLNLAGWGDNQLGGVYRETITGLHRNSLRLEGVFRLHHVSEVPQLNDGQPTN